MTSLESLNCSRAVPEISIKEIQPENAESYKKLRLKALTKEPDAFLQKLEEVERQAVDEFEAEIRRWQASGGFALAAGRRDGELIGMVGVGRPSTDRGYIWGVYVDSEARGLGVGTKLFNEVISRARRTPGLAQLEMEVFTTNTDAIRLYQKLGFKAADIQQKKDELLLVLQVVAEAR